jgi:hypothetical protein
LLLKLDIAKAFDTVAWQYLLEILQRKGFGSRWLNWISLLLGLASSSILLNGIPGPKIWHARGLRQGDALSPMLFVIAMDSLNHIFEKSEQEGIISELLVGQIIPQRLSVYADDVIIFLKATREDAIAVNKVLDIFGGASGLRCNMAKSSISSIHCATERVVEISDILNCQISELPIIYLGSS